MGRAVARVRGRGFGERSIVPVSGTHGADFQSVQKLVLVSFRKKITDIHIDLKLSGANFRETQGCKFTCPLLLAGVTAMP
jgi:hypothetical protein